MLQCAQIFSTIEMILQNMILSKNLGSKNFVVCAWVGGANITLLLYYVAHFCEAKYEIPRRRKRGRGGNSFSPHPFFFPPRPNGQEFRSKWVRAAFRICDQLQLGDFSARIFHEFSQSQPTFLASRRRFGIAKQFTNEVCIQFFPVPLRGTTKPVF